jgi:hypothetical protein
MRGAELGFEAGREVGVRREADDMSYFSDRSIGQQVRHGPSEAADTQVLSRTAPEQRVDLTLQLSTADAHGGRHPLEIKTRRA